VDVNMELITNKDYRDEDDLPHFGGSNRKEPNNANKNLSSKNEDIYMNNQSIDDIITENSRNENDRANLNTVNSKSANKNNNANNTFSKNESNINDDSIFAGTK